MIFEEVRLPGFTCPQTMCCLKSIVLVEGRQERKANLRIENRAADQPTWVELIGMPVVILYFIGHPRARSAQSSPFYLLFTYSLGTKNGFGFLHFLVVGKKLKTKIIFCGT